MKQFIPEVINFDALYDTLPMGIIISDAHENIEWVNPYFCQLLNTVPESLLGAPINSVFNLSKLQPINDVQRYEVNTDMGKQIWLQCTKTSVQDKKNSLHHIRFVSDISDFQARQSSKTPRNLSVDETRMDETTGVLNRKAILQELDTQVSRSRRYGNALSTIMFNCVFTQNTLVDKKDAILFSIANSIKANLRWVDQIGVIDQQRFLIIFPESNYEAAQQAWEKINNEILHIMAVNGQQFLDNELAICQWENGDDKERMLYKLEQGLMQIKAA